MQTQLQIHRYRGSGTHQHLEVDISRVEAGVCLHEAAIPAAVAGQGGPQHQQVPVARDPLFSSRGDAAAPAAVSAHPSPPARSQGSAVRGGGSKSGKKW